MFASRICVFGLLCFMNDLALALIRLQSVKLYSSLPSNRGINQLYDSHKEAVIIGSGPVGLASAIMLARIGYSQIKVFDQLSEPVKPDNASHWGMFRAERTYNIGITGRGILALSDLDCWNEYVEPFTAETYGSVVWTPESIIDKPSLSSQQRKYKTRCIERDRLTGCLLQVVKSVYSDKISVEFDTKCLGVAWHDLGSQNEHCTTTFQTKRFSNDSVFAVNSTFVIGSDGSNSAVRESLLAKKDSGIYSKRYPDVNEFFYRTIPIQFPRQTGFCPPDKDMSYSIRAKDGFNLEALPTKEGIHLGVVLFKSNNQIIRNVTNYEESVAFFQKYFPMALPGIPKEGLERFGASDNSKFQQFCYVYPKLHYSQSTVLLGDSIHTVKPFFGLGVNSGLEDVVSLKRALIAHPNSRGDALIAYSNERAKEAKALVQMQQRMDRGLLYFLVPLLLDRFFNKMFPKVFDGPVISSFSDETKTFTETLRRKTKDRFIQLTAISSLFVVLAKLLSIALVVLSNFCSKLFFRGVVQSLPFSLKIS